MYNYHQHRPRLEEGWCPEGCLDRFPTINFTQEKVLITGPALDHILEEVNLKKKYPEGRKELVNQV